MSDIVEKASSAERAVERYTEIGWLRAIVALIPIAGPALDALVTSTASEISKKRIEMLGHELQQVGQMLEAKLDKDVINSEEWLDLAVRALTAAARTRDVERQRMYAGLLLGSATADWPKELDNEAALSALAELTPTEIQMLAHFQLHPLVEGQPAGSVAAAQTAWNDAVAALPTSLGSNLPFHMKRIERVGFVSEVTGSFLGYGGGVYVFTPTFVQLMGALSATAGPKPT